MSVRFANPLSPARHSLREQVTKAEDFFGSGEVHVVFARASLRGVDEMSLKRGIAVQRIYKDGVNAKNLETLRPVHVQLVWRLLRDEFERAGELQCDEPFHVSTLELIALPPPPPEHVFERMMDPEAEGLITYDPRDDEPLMEFIDWYRAIAVRTRVAKDAAFAPYLEQLFDPRLTRLLWPSPAEIMAFEFALLRHVSNELQTKSFFKVEESLTDEMGFSVAEATQIRRLAISYLTEYGALSPDEARGLLMLRLESMFDMATKQYDSHQAFRVAKLQAQILGLGKEPPQDQREDFKSLAQALTIQEDRDYEDEPDERRNGISVLPSRSALALPSGGQQTH